MINKPHIIYVLEAGLAMYAAGLASVSAANWIGYSRWGMWIVLASKNPDHIIPGCGMRWLLRVISLMKG